MRLLVSEKRYETAVSSGVFRYENGSLPIGIIEKWRMTTISTDFSIVRVDIDQRLFNGRSYLFHLVLNDKQQPERLVYRYLDERSPQENRTGNVSFTPVNIINRQTYQGKSIQHEQPMQPFLLPSIIGLGLLAKTEKKNVITLATDGSETEQRLGMTNHQITYQPQRSRNLIPITIGNSQFMTTYLDIMCGSETYTIWCDKTGYPVKMKRPDGIVAVDIRPMRFRNEPSHLAKK